MQVLGEWPTLIDQRTHIVALESSVTERMAVLQQLYCWTQQCSLPLFFWNPGYSSIQQVQFQSAQGHFVSTSQVPNSDILQFLLEQRGKGIFVLEGIVEVDIESISNSRVYQLMNAYYDLPHSENFQSWLLLGDSIQLPSKLLPLIPVLSNPLPDGHQVTHWLQIFFDHQPLMDCSQEGLLALTKACLGLPLGEIQSVLQRSLPMVKTDMELATHVIAYKVSKLRGRGLEFIAEPDVPVGGLDLLEQMLERASALLSPDAPKYGLSFPKGLILWGPPGTGKSLSAKHAAQKMGVPMIAADWGGLISGTPGESEANLRFLLQIAEATSPCVLYWDDFDKAFAGWNSEASGGVLRRLAGKLLTWMQERTAPIFVIATVNRLEMLPPELNRRFDDIVFVDLPHAGARKAIFDIHLKKYFPAFRSPAAEVSTLSDEQWHRLLRAYNLCTAAEIGKSVRKAAEEAFYHHRPGQVTFQDLLDQRQLFTPAMIREEEQLLTIRKRANYARPASSPDTSKWRIPPAQMFEFLGDH
jgi:hypothetical protein